MSNLIPIILSLGAVVIYEVFLKDALESVPRHLRQKFPGVRFSKWLQARHLSRLLKLNEDWIHLAEALYIVNSFEYVDDQIRELVHAIDVYVTPDNQLRFVQDTRRVAVQLEKLNETVPKKILDRFVEANPQSYRDGQYSRQSLIFWLRADQHNWEKMLKEWS